jgi:hypothetical protein
MWWMEIRGGYDKSAGICAFMMALGRDVLLHTLAATKQRSFAYSMAFSGVCLRSVTIKSHAMLPITTFRTGLSKRNSCRRCVAAYSARRVCSLTYINPTVSQLSSVQNLLFKSFVQLSVQKSEAYVQCLLCWLCSKSRNDSYLWFQRFSSQAACLRWLALYLKTVFLLPFQKSKHTGDVCGAQLCSKTAFISHFKTAGEPLSCLFCLPLRKYTSLFSSVQKGT